MNSDHLDLLSIQSGLVVSPIEGTAAAGASDLCREQSLLRTGAPLPLVFTRRENGIGGCLVSPPATEVRFENNTSNVLTVSWHLVVSEGPMDLIQARDVFQCACRVGDASQAFSKRSGAWLPGNEIIDRGGSYTPWEAPRFCGTPATYDDLHTLSFVKTYTDGSQWNKQIHVFCRGGKHVTRLADQIEGPSSNVVDLFLLLLRKIERTPESLIDFASLEHAARFTKSLGMRFDGSFSGESTTSFDDWCENVLKPYFLLIRTRVNGREGLQPLLPTNANGTVYTGRVAPHATLTEDHLDLTDWDCQFIPLSERKPIRAQMMWRQQGEGLERIVRTSEVFFEPPYDAINGPYEQHDLSAYACSEVHIAKAGAYLVAHRTLVHHTLRVPLVMEPLSSSLQEGKIVRVIVPRTIDGVVSGNHDYLYRIVNIERSLLGTTILNLVHFPLDSRGRSAIAMAVVNATAQGYLYPMTPSGEVCDENPDDDTTPLPDDSIPEDDLPLPPPEAPDIPIPPPDPGDPTSPGGGNEGTPGSPPDVGDPEAAPPEGPPDGSDPPTPGPDTPSQPGQPGQPNSSQPNPDDPKPPTGGGQPGGGQLGGPWGPQGPPRPGAQTWDLFWEQLDTRFDSEATDSNGQVVLPPSTGDGGWNARSIENVQTWIFVDRATTIYSYHPTDFDDKPGKLILGINGFNMSEQTTPGNGIYLLPDAVYLKPINSGGQGYTTASGPVFNNLSRTWMVQIRNLRIRPHGFIGPSQPMEPGNPVNGDDFR
jgi:hypothetical protein